jgi:hypothetical protein
MPKVEEFYPSRASRREPLGRAIILIIKDGAQRDNNFRHFRSFLSSFVVSTFYSVKTAPSDAKYIFEIASKKFGCLRPWGSYTPETHTANSPPKDSSKTGRWSLTTGYWPVARSQKQAALFFRFFASTQ